MSNIKTTNLGLKPLNSRYKKKSIAWPIFVYRCIIPNENNTSVDILQKLILSLYNIENIRIEDTISKLGISIDLFKTIKEECISKGYLNKNENLTQEGLKVIYEDDLYVSDIDQSNDCKKIYLLRDGVSGDIIPNFSVENIFRSRFTDYEKLILPKNDEYKNAPSQEDILRGIKTQNNLINFVASKKQAYTTDNIEIAEEDFEDISKEEKIDDIDNNEQSTIIEDINEEILLDDLLHDDEICEIEDIDEEEKEEAVEITEEKEDTIKPVSAVKIWDNSAELIYVDSYIYVNPDKPESWHVRSPLGYEEDFWFTNRLKIQTNKDEDLHTEVEFLYELMIEELKEENMLYTKYDIPLFNKFESIVLDEKYKYLKREIESVKRVEHRINSGDEDYDTLLLRCQKALECLFELCISNFENLDMLVSNVNIEDFKSQLEFLSSNLDITIPYNYDSYEICKSLANINSSIKSGSIKDKALMVLFDAYYNKNLRSLNVIKDMPDFLKNINLIAHNRNATSHFNEEVYISKEEIQQILDIFNAIVMTLFLNYLGV